MTAVTESSTESAVGCRNAKRHEVRDPYQAMANPPELHELFQKWLAMHAAVHKGKHKRRAVALALGVVPETFYRTVSNERPGHFTDETLAAMSARLRMPASKILACIEEGLEVPLEFAGDRRRKKELTAVTSSA